MRLEIRVQVVAPADVGEWVLQQPQHDALVEAIETLGTSLGRLPGGGLQMDRYELASYFDVDLPAAGLGVVASVDTGDSLSPQLVLDPADLDVAKDARQVSEDWNDLRPAEMTEWTCLHYCWQLDSALRAVLELLSKHSSDQAR